MTAKQSFDNDITTLLNNDFMASFRADLLNQYDQFGDTEKGSDEINFLAKHFFRNIRESSYYVENIKPFINQLASFKQHQQIKIIDKTDTKLALHIMPRRAEIPMHAHLGKFNLIMVEQGSLKIKQKSLVKNSIKSGTHNVLQLLSKDSICVGLPILNNMHEIKSLTDKTVFFSLRIDSQQKKKQIGYSIKGLLKHVLASTVCLAMMPFILQQNTANACDSDDLIYEENQRTADNSALTAALNRKSTNYEKQVDAANWYKKSALRGDAESQYWLGVMNLDGSGITEDDDEALKWISRSADQGYKPAEKLLTHILTTDYVLDC